MSLGEGGSYESFDCSNAVYDAVMMLAHGVEGMLLTDPSLTPERLKGPELYKSIITRKGLYGLMVHPPGYVLSLVPDLEPSGRSSVGEPSS